MLGKRQARQLAKGRVHVDQLHQRIGGLPTKRQVRSPDDHGHTGGNLVIRRFPPNSHVTQMPSMVTPHDDYGVVANPCFVQGIQHQPDLGVDVADAGIIAMQQRTGEVVPDGALLRYAVAGTQLEGGMQPSGRPTLRALGLRG